MESNHARQAVVVSLEDLADSSVPFETLEAAFGPSSLGILIVKDLPTRFSELRSQLLSDASYLAALPPEDLERLSCIEAKYLSGWSHGKEALKTGSYDLLKGSFYVNCAFYNGKDDKDVPPTFRKQFPEFTAPNVWPAEATLPGFRATFEELCTIIIDTAALVARACDRYAEKHIEDYPQGYLERVVKSSVTTKARLLHYFPPDETVSSSDTSQAQGSSSSSKEPQEPDQDTWCATHVDHGCLTGLTSAAYIDEAAHIPRIPAPDHGPPTTTITTTSPTSPSSLSPTPPRQLPFLPHPPSTETGLYIHARDTHITKISIPANCLGFQTGEALQLITRGKFRAVPHFVRAGGVSADGGGEGGGGDNCGGGAAPGTGSGTGIRRPKVARNTLAVFTQPNLDEVVDRERGTTFGEFSREVVGRFG